MNRRKAIALLATLPAIAVDAAAEPLLPLSPDQLRRIPETLPALVWLSCLHIETAFQMLDLETNCPGLKTLLIETVAPQALRTIAARYPNLRGLLESLPVDVAKHAADSKARAEDETKAEAERLTAERARLQAAKEEAAKPRPFKVRTKEEILRHQARQTEETYREVLQTDLGIFASYLNKARWIWRHAPELIQAPEFPEPFRSAFQSWDPGDCSELYDDYMSPADVDLDDEDSHPPFGFLADPTLPGYREAFLLEAARLNFAHDTPTETVAEFLRESGLRADSIEVPF